MLSATKCTVTEKHAKVRIRCAHSGNTGSGGSCRATAVRRSLIVTRPEYLTPLDYQDRAVYIFRGLPLTYSHAG